MAGNLTVSLDGRVALVTGASRGIGRGIARTLAEAGADVALNYHRDKAAAIAVAAEITALGRKAIVYQASVDDPAQIATMVESVIVDFGALDIVVSNAGPPPQRKRVADTPRDEVEAMMRVNAFAAHTLCAATLPHLRKRSRSDIVMISSVGVRNNSSGYAAYNMAKAAITALAVTLSKEEREHGVRVNVVSPGLIETDMTRAVVKKPLAELDAAAPYGRIGRPEDVGRLIAFLVSDLNSYANGQNIYVDGGGPLEAPLA